MKNYSLGEFEELVLLVVAGQNGEAYGVTIQETLTSHLSRNINISAVHAHSDDAPVYPAIHPHLYKALQKRCLLLRSL